MTGIPRLILAIIVLGGLLAGARAEPPSAGDNGRDQTAQIVVGQIR